jgi:general secretion pathway protein I
MQNRPRTGEAGFTLLEILVAFAILGLAAGAILSMFGSNIARIARSENQRLAVMAARSVMARAGGDIALEPGTRKGEMPGGIRWSMSVKPAGGDANENGDDGSPPVTEAYLVAVRAAAGPPSDASIADLVSLRLMPGSPQ